MSCIYIFQKIVMPGHQTNMLIVPNTSGNYFEVRFIQKTEVKC